MEKEIFVLSVSDSIVSLDDFKKKDPVDWRFMGAFKTSDEARRFADRTISQTSYTIVPLDLLENFNTYFNQWKYCRDCDKYYDAHPDTEDHIVYLVQKVHEYGGVGEWHFESILPSKGSAELHIFYSGEEKKNYKIIPLKLPFHKNEFDLELRQLRVVTIDRRETQVRQREEKEKVEKEEFQNAFRTVGTLVTGSLVLTALNIYISLFW